MTISKRFWNFAPAKDSDEIELRIEGEIVSDDDAWLYEWSGIKTTTPNAFRDELATYSGKDITVWINSWGGDVVAAAGIYTALKEHNGRISVKIDSKAVSAASVIAMAGEQVLMSPTSIMMIHNPWSFLAGEARDMRHEADVLDEFKETIINAYQLKSGRSRNKISQLMDEETWMSPKKAMAEGFADGILYAQDDPKALGVQDSFMFSRLAIQNSAAASMRRLFDGYRRLNPPEPPAPDNRPDPIDQEQKALVDSFSRLAQANKNRGR
jgi:ATP-dependent Clp protease protease subunit